MESKTNTKRIHPKKSNELELNDDKRKIEQNNLDVATQKICKTSPCKGVKGPKTGSLVSNRALENTNQKTYIQRANVINVWIYVLHLQY